MYSHFIMNIQFQTKKKAKLLKEIKRKKEMIREGLEGERLISENKGKMKHEVFELRRKIKSRYVCAYKIILLLRSSSKFLAPLVDLRFQFSIIKYIL